MGTHMKMQFRALSHLFLLLCMTPLLLNTTCDAINHQNYILNVQRNISVQKGLCVYIPCTFTVDPAASPSMSASCIWYKESYNGEIICSQNPSQTPAVNRERIVFTGHASRMDCSMAINEVLDSDGEKAFLFRLQDGSRSYNFIYYMVTLNVTELTDKPEITPVKNLRANEEVTLICQSPGRCNGSEPTIIWNGKVDKKTVTYHITHPDGKKTYYSNITFTPSKEDNQSPLFCLVRFKASSAETVAKITLNVEYCPTVCFIVNDTIHNENIPIIVMEGKSEIIKCTVDSNPQSNITWYKGEIALQNTSSRQTLIYNVKNANLSDAGIYRCSATNSLSTTNKSIEVTVHYVPRTPQINCSMPKDCIIEGNKTIYINEGSSLSLRCSAESSPAASLAWLKPGNPNTISLDEELHFSNILHSNDGLYTCQANNTYGRSNASVTIKVIYGPRAVSGKDSTCATEERVIKCTCIIQSFPDVNIQWKIDEKSYAISDKDILISTSRFDEETTSMMDLLLNHNEVHSIQCISSNQHNHFTLSLLSKEPKSSLWMIVAVTVVLAVTVILGIAFIILQFCRRRKLKQENKDKNQLTSNSDDDVIYTNSNILCNGGGSQEIPQKNSLQDDGAIYVNCKEVEYASINFIKPRPSDAVRETEPETEYASIKPQ
ncbi:sialic acid-binding Ig-like lectin 16 [Pyxicephalus adspersus]|uniref:sialic acid-binding Ig-like lectin 16 n=1 Tax=Pyxicephalus adspersus TaxID=30357 RepID=UPI003B5C1A33